MTETKNLGWVQAIISSTIPPTNKKMLWYDENTNLHKYWSIELNSWVSLLESSVKFIEVITDTEGSKSLKLTLGDNSEIYTDSLCCGSKTTKVYSDFETCPDEFYYQLGDSATIVDSGDLNPPQPNVQGVLSLLVG
jgi:hypothetical protein